MSIIARSCRRNIIATCSGESPTGPQAVMQAYVSSYIPHHRKGRGNQSKYLEAFRNGLMRGKGIWLSFVPNLSVPPPPNPAPAVSVLAAPANHRGPAMLSAYHPSHRVCREHDEGKGLAPPQRTLWDTVRHERGGQGRTRHLRVMEFCLKFFLLLLHPKRVQLG